MTLGGLALAVGILVDDATVEIENNHRHLDLGKPLRQAILDGAAEVATPAFVSTLSICIVFVPILLLSGVGGALFSPLAMAVVFAMLASYLLSRTLVPTMVLYLLAPEAHARPAQDTGRDSPTRAVNLPANLRFLRVGLPQTCRAYRGRARLGAGTHAGGDRGVPWLCARFALPLSVRRPGLLSHRRCRAAAVACKGRRRGRGSKRPKSTSSRSRIISVSSSPPTSST